MATERDTPACSRFLTAVRRRSCRSIPEYPAFRQAVEELGLRGKTLGVDGLTMRLTDAMLSIPIFFFLLTVLAVFGSTVPIIIVTTKGAEADRDAALPVLTQVFGSQSSVAYDAADGTPQAYLFAAR